MNVWQSRPRGADERARQVKEPNHPCIHCGKTVKPGKGTWVEITIDGDVIPEGDPRSGVWNVSQGGFVLGPDCYRKIVGGAK